MYAFLVGIGVLAAIGALISTRQTKVYLAKAKDTKTANRASQLVSTLIVVAQLAELSHSLEHVSAVHVAATLLLGTVWIASKGAPAE